MFVCGWKIVNFPVTFPFSKQQNTTVYIANKQTTKALAESRAMLTLTTLSLLTVANMRSLERPLGPYPPNIATWFEETLVNEKWTRGGGMSPVMVGTVHWTIKWRNTTRGKETMHALTHEMKTAINTNYCHFHLNQGTPVTYAYMYI